MHEEIVAIAVEEIGRAELPKLLSKHADDTEPCFEGWGGRREPKGLEASKQSAKGILGVGLTNRPESSEREVGRAHDVWDMAIMGKDVEATAEFTHIGLRILQR